MNLVQPSNDRALVPSAPLLQSAQTEGRAVAALNFYNAETLRAHIEAAREVGTPLILQTTEATIRYLGLGLCVAMAQAAALELEHPVALHLDHGQDAELARQAIEAGYTSVMIDGSKLPFEANCDLTSSVVAMARPHGVSVEAELGHVGQAATDDPAASYTDPEEAARFVELTRIDSLAVAIGTAHGFYKGPVKLSFSQLAKIRAAVPHTPLVLHGGSGVDAELLDRAVQAGITKINFGTDIKNAFTLAVKRSLASSGDIDLRRTFAPAIAAVRELSREKMRICRRIGALRDES